MEDLMPNPEHSIQSEQPRDINKNPAFKAGKFEINILATSPEGLEVITRNTLRRRQGIWEPGEKLPIPDDKREPIAKGMQFEVAMALTNAGITFPDPKEDPMLDNKIAQIQSQVMTPEQRDEYNEKVNKARKSVARRRRIEKMTSAERTAYLKEFSKSQKTGFRNIDENDNGQIVGDVVSVPYPFYRHIGDPQIHTPENMLLADVAATAMILKTSDNLLVVQHRSPKNAAYGDIPGASAAGLLEGSINRRSTPGTLKPINTDSVINNGAIEASQELGVKQKHSKMTLDTRSITDYAIEKAAAETGEDPADIRRVRITGLATDNRKYHHEFLLYGELRHTAKELLEEARKAKQAKDPDKFDPVDFEEQFFFIPGTIEAIETLLTDIKSPLPDTHGDAFIAAVT